MPDGPVLVVGATGRTGRLIVARLVERGIPVRALVRDAARGGEVLPPEVSQHVGDVRRGETLAEPVAGARAMIIATCSSADPGNEAETVDYFGTSHLLEQAAAAGRRAGGLHLEHPRDPPGALPGHGADEPGVEGESRGGDPRFPGALFDRPSRLAHGRRRW